MRTFHGFCLGCENWGSGYPSIVLSPCSKVFGGITHHCECPNRLCMSSCIPVEDPRGTEQSQRGSLERDGHENFLMPSLDLYDASTSICVSEADIG